MSKNEKMESELTQEEELKKIEEKIEDAIENLGDVEIRDAIYEKAKFYEKLQNFEKAIEVYHEAFKKTIGTGKKMDIYFDILLIYIQKQNLDMIKDYIGRQKKILEDGGDWERKNRLKVYEGIHFLMIRDFKSASQMFLDSVSTFTAKEVITYNELVKYTVLTSMITLHRSELRKQVVSNPEILSTIRELPNVKRFLDSFYKCDYKETFKAFVDVLDELQEDKYLSKHRKFYIREMRVVIYSQFLEAYKTVTLQNMSDAFGVSVSFIDRELSELISANRLTCKIDKVASIIASERIDERNNKYKSALKEGDMLLNRVQKLSRVIDI